MAITDKRQYIPGPGGMGDLPFSKRLVTGSISEPGSISRSVTEALTGT
jgi:hypothetical protein